MQTWKGATGFESCDLCLLFDSGDSHGCLHTSQCPLHHAGFKIGVSLEPRADANVFSSGCIAWRQSGGAADARYKAPGGHVKSQAQAMEQRKGAQRGSQQRRHAHGAGSDCIGRANQYFARSDTAPAAICEAVRAHHCARGNANAKFAESGE